MTSINNTNCSVNDTITPINKETVHKICSGQVVLSLAIAVKELLENAIDASANIIEIRLKDYGSEFIEVSDNGTGVKNENFQNLTLKHYTSKLREFNDLESVTTLGFRGEALSSLCALSDLTIITRHASADHATKITYDHNGKIIATSPIARNVGTTVILKNLFKSLPVRRKEFLKNSKKEFNKMCQLVYAYCLVCKGIKITCSNQTNNGSKNVVVATLGNSTIRENIINVFGPKQVPTLIEIDLIEPDETVLKEFDLKPPILAEPLPFKFEFLISSVMHGSGRSTADRQFFYINNRPCEPQKVMKLINEVYKQFNTNQYPFVYLNIEMERSCIDVNVTPDKRQIFLEKEKLLLAVIKSSLLEAFKTFPSTFTMQNTQIDTKITNYTSNSPRGFKRPLQENENESEGVGFLSKFKKSSNTSITNKSELEENHDEREDSRKLKNTDLREYNSKKELSHSFEDQANAAEKNLEVLVNIACKLNEEKNHEKKERLVDIDSTENMRKKEAADYAKNVKCDLLEKDVLEKPTCKSDINKSSDELNVANSLNKNNTPAILIDDRKDLKPKNISCKEDIEKKSKINITASNTNKINSQAILITTSVNKIKESLKVVMMNKDLKKKDILVRFKSKISPEANRNAEEELKKQISKDMFQKMSTIGQFNLGFIITKLESDLFIIDQHATDEKYNFEILQQTTVLESQTLVNPKPLELSAPNESLLIDNEEVFKRNGFSFLIKKDAPVTKKVFLTAVPISKNYTFGKDDIDEMLFMLQENINPEVCRPSRIRSMFASRACRKSVMIGCPLSHFDMRRLVDHMGEIEHPWNCPHGRPTMRHLINLDLVHKED